MSFLKRLFGGGAAATSNSVEPKEAGRQEHEGFLIIATPFNEGGQYQVCGVISKEVDGTMKEHKFIRADKFASLDDTINITLAKGRQIINEQGRNLFG